VSFPRKRESILLEDQLVKIKMDPRFREPSGRHANGSDLRKVRGTLRAGSDFPTPFQ
jgi:hypothetical protein